MLGCKLLRIARPNHVVVRPVENQTWLSKIRLVFIPAGVLEQLIAELHRALLGVVEHFHGSRPSPLFDLLGAQILLPAARESKTGSQQHHAFNLRVPRGVKRRHVSAHARAHQRDRLPRCRALDYAELASDREVLEIAGREVGSVNPRARGLQTLAKVAGLVRSGTRSEAVQVQDARRHFLGGAAGGGSGRSVNLISVSAVNSL